MKFYKKNDIIYTSLNGNLDEVALDVNNVDASFEKHVPHVLIEGNKVTVKVGEVSHPMEDFHYIEFIMIETKNGMQFKKLNPGDKPMACFDLVDDEFIKAYAYCNLHGMWEK